VTISFQGFWESVYPEISDTFVQFDVMVLDPTRQITGVSLFAPGLSVTGNGRVRIDETVKTLDNQMLGDLTVATSLSQVYDATSFAGQSAVRISKDIALFAGRLPMGSSAGLSYFEQTFTQTVIPEPTSVALLGLGAGVLGIVALRRRSR
jgi:hypothetical protein